MPEKEYIERSALIKEIRGLTTETWGKGLKNGWWSHSVQIKDNFLRLIEKSPAADVVEVVHASWDKDGRCTNCGGHAPYIPISLAYHKSPYCFTCGAKMDGATDTYVGGKN